MNIKSPSHFAQVEAAPPDPILGLTEAFNADTNPSKVNLGVGVYKDADGKVPVLKTVREAEKRWYEKETTKSYLPIDGIPAYKTAVQELLFGSDSPILTEKNALTIQTLGGTGALKVGADFLKKFFPQASIYISNPSWANHRQIFATADFNVETYSYYNPENHGLDFDAMISDIKKAPAGSIILLHACCHNPTGVDPSDQQWEQIVDIFKNNDLIPFLDFAYQGFGDGIDEDAYAVRAFANAGIPCLIASSFSKSMSIYCERVGALTVLTGSQDEAKRVLSQIKTLIRTNYSNAVSHGGQVATIILTDPQLRKAWELEVKEMRNRIHDMRSLFVQGLAEQGVSEDFSFITKQKGMFSFTGFSKDTVAKLRNDYSIYIVGSGRVCIAAMNATNIPVICKAIAETLKA